MFISTRRSMGKEGPVPIGDTICTLKTIRYFYSLLLYQPKNDWELGLKQRVSKLKVVQEGDVAPIYNTPFNAHVYINVYLLELFSNIHNFLPIPRQAIQDLLIEPVIAIDQPDNRSPKRVW
ncbi:hypothetical protein QVD17_19942 [Tagetes erecta]|uniref:Uncharacterized protein n=1 Tax=Tagetes erecta TaxID=13708 RepID=A0AAD8NXN4_TARER|nr:hypothetical protein QVD17_19942 [Tagetes erecta]